jgi:two-component system NtrC family sensor kinase
VGTGREALDVIQRERFDVVTLDLRLPDIDGKTVWREMLARDPSLAARVVFLTGDTMSAETQRFLEEARRPVLSKPLTIDRIGRMIQDILSG